MFHLLNCVDEADQQRLMINNWQYAFSWILASSLAQKETVKWPLRPTPSLMSISDQISLFLYVMSTTHGASNATDEWKMRETNKIKSSSFFLFSPNSTYEGCLRCFYFGTRAERRGGGARQWERRRELKRKDRDGEMDEDTATGDWVTKLFACSLTAGSPSLSSLQLRLLLRGEQIMTRGRSTRFRVQTLCEGWRSIQQSWMLAAGLHLGFNSLGVVYRAYRCRKNVHFCTF